MAERKEDKTLEDSFPASDPPARSGITGDDRPARQRPTGTPLKPRISGKTRPSPGRDNPAHPLRPKPACPRGSRRSIAEGQRRIADDAGHQRQAPHE